jgi:hypothetical protein
MIAVEPDMEWIYPSSNERPEELLTDSFYVLPWIGDHDLIVVMEVFRGPERFPDWRGNRSMTEGEEYGFREGEGNEFYRC